MIFLTLNYFSSLFQLTYDFLDWFTDCIYTNGVYYAYDNHSKAIWMKAIDNNPPVKWMSIDLYQYTGSCLRVALNGEALLVNQNQKAIVAIHLTSKKQIKLTIPSQDSKITDHEPFGELEDHLVTKTDDGWIHLHKFDFNTNTAKIVSKLKIEFVEGREEQAMTLSVSPNSKFIAVTTRDKKSMLSRLFIIEVKDDLTLVVKHTKDVNSLNIKYFFSTVFHEFVNNRLVVAGLTCSHPKSMFCLFEYDVINNLCDLIEDFTDSFDFYVPLKMVMNEGVIHATDYKGRLLSVKFSC